VILAEVIMVINTVEKMNMEEVIWAQASKWAGAVIIVIGIRIKDMAAVMVLLVDIEIAMELQGLLVIWKEIGIAGDITKDGGIEKMIGEVANGHLLENKVITAGTTKEVITQGVIMTETVKEVIQGRTAPGGIKLQMRYLPGLEMRKLKGGEKEIRYWLDNTEEKDLRVIAAQMTGSERMSVTG